MDAQCRQAMDTFFRESEQQAYLTAMTLTHNHHDALELVQESMLKLVQKYQHRAPEEWPPLFYRILHNGVKDWYRRQKFRQLLSGLMPWQSDEAIASSGATSFGPSCVASAEHSALVDDELAQIQRALHQLPLRQQQTFLLRAWQEMSTRETAQVLAISENSVKTHYARASQKLRHLLGDESNEK